MLYTQALKVLVSCFFLVCSYLLIGMFDRGQTRDRPKAALIKSQTKDKLVISAASDDEIEYFTVKTMCITGVSDTYRNGHNYAGFIIYHYEHIFSNQLGCGDSYIVIRDTDS